MEILWKSGTHISLRFLLKFLSFYRLLGAKFLGNSFPIPWKFCRNFNGNSVEIPWKFCRNSMELTQEFYGSSIEMVLKFYFIEITITWIQFWSPREMEIKLMCNVRQNFIRHWYLVLRHFERFYMEDPYKITIHLDGTNVKFLLNCFRTSI